MKLPTKQRKDNYSPAASDVLSDDPEQEVTLEWEGPGAILGRSWLIDQNTGEVIEPDNRGHYTFTMDGLQRRFTWEYEKRPSNARRKH
ncbi:MAG: hypothetical protein DRR06_06190 [Gammaproteobacteria bacterium]|nr:MAG: hypothetical protein DRR06_06190 [Gammaproteobacteria bacterium]